MIRAEVITLSANTCLRFSSLRDDTSFGFCKLLAFADDNKKVSEKKNGNKRQPTFNQCDFFITINYSDVGLRWDHLMLLVQDGIKFVIA